MTYLERIGQHLGLIGRAHSLPSDARLARSPPLDAQPEESTYPEPPDEQTSDTLPMVHFEDV